MVTRERFVSQSESELPAERRLVSVPKRQTRHDAEAQQDEEHLEELLPGGVELVREDLQKGDVNEGPRGEPLQDGLDERPRRQLGLHHADADGDAYRRHHGEHADVGGHPQRAHGALDELHRQAEDYDAFVDKDGDADLQHLAENGERNT